MKPTDGTTGPEEVAAFLEEMLNQLSSLAENSGHRALATTLMLAALDAGRAKEPPEVRP